MAVIAPHEAKARKRVAGRLGRIRMGRASIAQVSNDDSGARRVSVS
jgi:hypothetical protein